MADLELVDDPGPRNLAEALRDRRALLAQVGAYLESTVQEAFQNQGHPGAPWAPKQVPSLPGVVRDLVGGGAPKADRFEPHPVLRDTGQLLQSISSTVEGDDGVVVGSSVPYARTHHEGLTSETQVPRSILPAVKRLFGTHPEHVASWARLVDVILNQGGVLETRVQRRPLVRVGEQEAEAISQIAVAHLLRALGVAAPLVPRGAP